MAGDVLLVKKKNGILTLTLNDPENSNVLSRPMAEALRRELEKVWEDPEVRVLVLKGEG